MEAFPRLSKGNGVPARDPKLHWVETVEANSKIRFRCWSPAIWEVWTHYSGRTQPCFENHDLCKGGHDESTLRWYGYVFGYHEHRRGPGFVQLTVGAARLWMAQIADGVSLRGMVFDIQRGASKKGPQLLNVVHYVHNSEEQMGKDCDPQLSLFRMWHVNHLGHALKLSLVSGPADIPEGLSDDGCLKTHTGALSSKEGKRASRGKSTSRKPNRKREPA